MKMTELDQLIDLRLEGVLSPEEAARLSALLETSPEARARYWQAASVHGLLEGALQGEWLSEASRPKASSRAAWSWWPALRQMAAGVLLGGIGVSAVWAYALPKVPVEIPLPVADAGFESGLHRGNSVPMVPGHWSGDPMALVHQQDDVQPHDGSQMLRFLSADSDGDKDGGKHMASDLWQVLDLPGEGIRTVKVSAWFNAATSKQARFHLMAMASEDSTEFAPQIWDQRYLESSLVPAAARSMIFVDSDSVTWERGEVTLQVPAKAKTLILGIAAYRLPAAPAAQWFPAQFVDDVTVTMTSEEVLP